MAAPNHHPLNHYVGVVDAGGVTAIFAYWFGWLPPLVAFIATVLAAVYYALLIREMIRDKKNNATGP